MFQGFKVEGSGRYLRVAARYVERDRVECPRDDPPHLNVRYAVVDPHERLPPHEREHARDDSADSERPAHARALRVANAVKLVWLDLGLGHGLPRQADDVPAVVLRRLLGQESGSWWRDVCVSDVGQNGAVLADDADAELVGAALDPQRDHLPLLSSLYTPLPTPPTASPLAKAFDEDGLLFVNVGHATCLRVLCTHH